MNCYKCGSGKDLSLKARDRQGNAKIFMCKNCRSTEYYEKKDTYKDKEDAEWLARAKASYEAIEKKYGVKMPSIKRSYE